MSARLWLRCATRFGRAASSGLLWLAAVYGMVSCNERVQTHLWQESNCYKSEAK